MKICYLILFMFSFFGIQGQEKNEIFYSTPLSIGEELWFGNNHIQFSEVISDSRCPKDVTCVWEGEAKVRVHVFENGKLLEDKIISINSGSIPLGFSKGGSSYLLSKLNLLPYPTTKNKGISQNYTLQLMVTETYNKS